MAFIPELKVLFFDTFGTTVAQREPVAKALHEAAQAALENDSSIHQDIRTKAEAMTYDDWDKLGNEWNAEEGVNKKAAIEKTSTVDWQLIDQQRIDGLPRLLADRGLIVSSKTSSVGPGSLINKSQLGNLGRIWHRLTPWPDSIEGLSLLNQKYTTASLSNTYHDLLQKLISNAKLPFQHAFSSDLFESYKPNPKVYLGAAEKLGVKPAECALVAAHLNDLKAAKACGFYAIYVERPLEEKNPELAKENIPDLVIKDGEGGFLALAERLGCHVA